MSQKQKPVSQTITQEFPLVAVGASAGGLEALTAILGALPSDIAMAFVLIQHLDPKRHSMMPELLSKATKIPVLEAADAMKVEPNRVYVMPSNVDMSLTDGHFALVPRSRGRELHLPIDIFMRSLAAVHQSGAIGVILSGTASDGTAGIEAIRAAGGVTFAQDPETAKFNGMPRSAIDSGCIDFVLSPIKIAEKLAWISRHPTARREPVAQHEGAKNDDGVFASILDLVSNSQGPDFHEYKPSTIRRRTQQRMAALGIASIAGYRTYLEEHSEEVARLSNHVLIPVTEFFRNPEVFEDLEEVVYPAIVGTRGKEGVRIWVVACSSGEEAYSIAITLQELLGANASRVQSSTRIQIFGTDINEKGIAKARAGIYPESAFKNVSEDRIARFFTAVPGGYRINKAIRDLCVFARQDVTRDPPFSNIDLVSCRNFLIYVQPELQERILSTLHYALKPSGFLLLGNAESASSYSQLFSPVAVTKKGKIYSKKDINPTQQRTFKRNQVLIQANVLPAAMKTLSAGRASQDEVQAQELADQLMLKDYAPAGVIVNEALEILHFRGQTSPYLEQSSGRANLNLLNMVREELAIPLRTILALAKKKAVPVKKKNVEFEHSGKKRIVNLSVTPLGISDPTKERCYLILFEDATPLIASNRKKGQPVSSTAGDLVQRKLLEQKQELRAARTLLKEHLAAQQALSEDYQSANEELLSANEELQSTNEELETSKEELESANEELITVNDELNSNNSTLHLLGNDLKNLLESTVIPIVMVDSGLCIRRVTPMAEKVFLVLPSDIGRLISDIKPDLNLDLKPLISKVVQDVVNIEKEVQDKQGHWYRLQIRPYKTLENHIDGAVLVLLDIDAIKKRNEELIRAGELTKSIIETMPQPVLVLSTELRVLMANHAFYGTFKLEPTATINEFVYRLGGGPWNRPGLRVLLEEAASKKFLNHEVECDLPEVGQKFFVLNGRYMVQEPAATPLILLSLTDITQIRKTEAALIRSEKLAIAARLAASVAHEINNPLEAITNLLYLASTGDDAAAAKEYSVQALQEVNRVSHITQQTLKFHRQSNFPSVVQISEIVDSLLVLYHGKLVAKNISVTCQFREVPSILCLAGDLRQIFANIIANAIDAMRSGGKLAIRVSPSVDWRNHTRRGIRTTIADSGIGMNLETIRRMYEPFFTTKSGTGTGLGMWVCAQLVERLNGDIRLWSTACPGKSGTAFSFFMPFELSK